MEVIHLSFNKAKLRNDIDASINKGYISIFRVINLESLNIKYFQEANETAIKVLLPNKLENQVCIKTEKAKNCLDFIGSEEYEQ